MSDGLLPLGYSPPFARVSHDDHTAWIVIATTLGMIYSIIFAGFRAFVAYTTRRKYGLDDMALYIATILAAVQSILNLVACSYGLGKSIEIIRRDERDEVQKMFYAVKLIFIVALGISKISVFMLLKQLSPQARHRKFFWGFIAFIAVWTAASLLALALQCDLTRPWIVFGRSCSEGRILLRWQVISAFDIFIEVAAVASILFIVWHLQTTWSNKATVGGAFALRLAMIIPIAFRLRTFSNEGIHADPTLAQSRFIIWTQAELHFSLISATIPCLRPVINKFVTHYGALGPAESSIYGSATGYGSRGRRADTYHLSSLKPSMKSRDRPAEGERQRKKSVQGKDGAYSYDIETSNDTTAKEGVSKRINSVDSHDSRQMIITRHLSWTVEKELGESAAPANKGLA